MNDQRRFSLNVNFNVDVVHVVMWAVVLGIVLLA
jgi:hypothetical protein